MIRNEISRYLNSVVPISTPITLQFGPVPRFEFEVEIKWSNRSKSVWAPWQGWSTRVQGSLAKSGDQMRWTLSHKGRTKFIGGYSGSALEHFKVNFVTDRFGNFISPGALDKSVRPISQRINELVGKPIVSGKINRSAPKLNVVESIEQNIFPGFHIYSDSTDVEVLGTAIVSGRKCVLVHVNGERQLKRDSDYGSIKQEQYILIDVITCFPHMGTEVARIFRFGKDGIIDYIRSNKVTLSYVKWADSSPDTLPELTKESIPSFVSPAQEASSRQLQTTANAQSVSVTICKQVNAAKTFPIDPTDRFGTDQRELHAIAVLKDAPKGALVKGTWVSVDAIAQPNYPIDSVTVQIQEKGDARVHFALSRPKKGWLVGKYKLDVYVNDKLTSTAPFSIR